MSIGIMALAAAMWLGQGKPLHVCINSDGAAVDCDAPPPPPIDVPAVVGPKYYEKHYGWIGGYPKCADPSRYLLGPNGKGEYICHKSQKEQQ